MERGVKPEQKRFFIIDGSKALRAGITEVFGKQPVQRCRLHKERNVVEPLPEGQQEEVCEQMRSAWKLPAEQGIAQLEKLARSLEKSAPGAAKSLLEGLQQMFTINRLGLLPSLQRSFSSTNVIDSTFNGTRRYTRNVSRWQDAPMALRSAAASIIEREAHFNKVAGFKLLARLENALLELNSTPRKRKNRELSFQISLGRVRTKGNTMEKYVEIVAKDMEKRRALLNRLVYVKKNGEVGGVLRVLAADLNNWADNLKLYLAELVLDSSEDLRRFWTVPNDSSPPQMSIPWILRSWIGSDASYALLEFYKDRDFAESFSERVEQLHLARIDFSSKINKYFVKTQGKRFDSNGWNALERDCKFLKRRANAFASYLRLIACQFESKAENRGSELQNLEIPQQTRKTIKRSTERGESRIKLISALTHHHQYAKGSILMMEPIGNNELARAANVSPSTASAFFTKEFQGHSNYRTTCKNSTLLLAALKLLNDEFTPHHLLGEAASDLVAPDEKNGGGE